MIGEVLLGLFSLALGWLCLSHASRRRGTVYSETSRGGEGGDDKPSMMIPTALGVLFLMIGKGLLLVAVLEMF